MATRLLHLMPRLRRVLLGDGHQASFNRVRDIPRIAWAMMKSGEAYRRLPAIAATAAA